MVSWRIVQLSAVDRLTETPGAIPTRVRFPFWGKGFFVHSQLSVITLLRRAYSLHVPLHASTSARTLNATYTSATFNPAYLSELLRVYTPFRTLRSSSDTRILKIQQHKRKTHGFLTFSCFGPHILNSLPQDLRHCTTLSSFKAKLKTFLFS